MALSITAELGVPQVISWTIDRATGASLPSGLPFKPTFINLASIIAFLLGVQFVGQVLGRRLFLLQSVKKVSFFKKHLWSHKLKNSDQEAMGRFINLSGMDVGSASALFGTHIMTAVTCTLMAGLGLLMMALISPLVAGAYLVFAPVALVGLRRLGKRQKNLHMHSQEEAGHLTETCTRSVKSLFLQRLFNRTSFWTKRLNDSAHSYSKSRLKSLINSNYIEQGMLLFAFCSFTLVVSIGTLLYFQGSLSLGNLVALTTYVTLIQPALIQMGHLAGGLFQSLGSLKRLEQRFHREPLALENTDSALFDPEFQQRIQIVGSTGSGKTTLMKKLLNQAIDKQHSTAWSSSEPSIFRESIKENVSFGQELSDGEVWAHLRTVDLEKEVADLPNGIHTIVAEDGNSLSGGQKQRLSLARCLASKAQTIFLDAPLTAVDESTKQKIYPELKKTWQDKNIVFVDFDPSAFPPNKTIQTGGQE